MPVEEMIDFGTPWTTAAAASPVGDQAVAAAPEKVPYTPPAGGALGANIDHDTSAFEVDLGDGCSLEDLIASDVNEFFDAFRALDGPDGAGFADGINAADQGMEVDDDGFAWLNSPDAFMPLPIADADGFGEVAATATPTGKEKEEEAEMAPGAGTEHVDEDVGRVLAGLVVSEATVETAPAAAAAVAATTTLPPVAVEGNTATSGIIGGQGAVSPHAPAHEFGAGGRAGGGAGYLLAQGPADDAAVVSAVGVSQDTVETAPAAAAAVVATTTLPPVALEGHTAETSGIIGGQDAVSPHAPAYDFGGGGTAGGAGYLFAEGPADGAAVVRAVGVEVGAAAPVTPTASSMTVNGGGGGSGNSGAGGHDGGLSQKELIRRQKVERYLAKKTRRRWSRASSYQSRQRVANSRPRHKGRFLPLVSDFVPISELKRRQRALLAQRAAEEEGEKQPPPQPLPAPGWGTSAEFPAEGDYGQGEG